MREANSALLNPDRATAARISAATCVRSSASCRLRALAKTVCMASGDTVRMGVTEHLFHHCTT